MDVPCKAAVPKIKWVNSVIDVREVGSDLNWFKHLKVKFIALQVLL
jgi:glycerol-3-phosphate cytidylyltransferase-like family protein